MNLHTLVYLLPSTTVLVPFFSATILVHNYSAASCKEIHIGHAVPFALKNCTFASN